MQIDHDADEWPYEQLAAILRGRIADGTYPPGTRLPSIVALVAESGLTAQTVQRAEKLLEAEGLVRIRANRGAFVSI